MNPQMKLTPIFVAYALAEQQHGRIVRDCEPRWVDGFGLQLVLPDQRPQGAVRRPPQVGARFDALAVATQMARDAQTVGLR